MKIAKKLLCMALSLMMILSCFSVVMAEETESGTNFSDVSKDQIYSDAVVTLNLMGVINGYPDGTFGPDQNVTRAEFTAMLMRTLKLGNIGDKSAAGMPFTDIDDNDSSINWAIPDINTAYGKGIINGYEDNTFRPSANVAFEEAVKMIVCTLGYGDGVDTSVTPWYSNFTTIASQIGVTKVASKIGRPETPATRACIAQLLYDSLEIKLVERNEKTDKTILSDYLGCIKSVGIISSNDITSLTSPDVNLREDEIQIYAKDEDSRDYETHTYTTTDTNLKKYLGYEVEFYYMTDGSDIRTLLFSVLKDNEPVKINVANIEERETSDSQIAYYEDLSDDRTKTINLSADNVVIYNGKLYGTDEDDSRFSVDMLPDVGELTLIDSDGNGKYDVIEMAAYEIYYVSSKSSSNYEITDNVVRVVNYPDDKSLKLNVDEDRQLKIVDDKGNDVNFSSISTGNIICFAESNDNGGERIRTAVVVNEKVTGTVTARNGKGEITINGKDYKYSKAAPWVTGGTTLAEPETQDSGTYYLDINGDIVAYAKNQTTDSVKYGFIMTYGKKKNSFDDEVTFRILTSNGSEIQLGTHKNTKVDGHTCSTGMEVVDALEDTAIAGADKVQQLIKYTTKTVSGANVLDQIYIAEEVSKGQTVEGDVLTKLDTITPDMTMTFNSTSNELSGEGAKAKISNATVISIPEDLDDYDNYRKTTVSSSFKNGKTYNVEVFDVSQANVAKVVVLYGADNSEAVDTLSPLYVFESLSEETNDAEDEVMNKASLYKINPEKKTAGSLTSEWLSDSSESFIYDMTAGDIFRAGTDKYGYVLAEEDYLVFDADGDVEDYCGLDIQGGDEMLEAEYVMLIGSIAANDEDFSFISVAEEKLDADSEYDTSDAITFEATDFEDALVLIYEKNNDGEIEISTESNYENAIASLSSYEQGSSDPSEVIIYMSDGEIKLFCVLPGEDE